MEKKLWMADIGKWEMEYILLHIANLPLFFEVMGGDF